jgi:hypothetical protein
MSPDMHKAATQAMVTMVYHRFKLLAAEFTKICDTVREMQNDPGEHNTLVVKTATEIVEELERLDHMGKLNIMATTLDDLRKNISAADPDEDFSRFLPEVKRVQEEAQEHFESFLPRMIEKLADARRAVTELN